jgi:DNA-binding transcriptional regulator WhiA
MKITPASDGRRFFRHLTTSTGEQVSEAYLIGALLASGSFAHRPQVEAEVESLFDLLTQIFDKLKERAA